MILLWSRIQTALTNQTVDLQDKWVAKAPVAITPVLLRQTGGLQVHREGERVVRNVLSVVGKPSQEEDFPPFYR